MQNLTIGAAVFVAILCGQPDLLAAICLYLSALIVTVAGIASVLAPSRVG